MPSFNADSSMDGKLSEEGGDEKDVQVEEQEKEQEAPEQNGQPDAGANQIAAPVNAQLAMGRGGRARQGPPRQASELQKWARLERMEFRITERRKGSGPASEPRGKCCQWEAEEVRLLHHLGPNMDSGRCRSVEMNPDSLRSRILRPLDSQLNRHSE